MTHNETAVPARSLSARRIADAMHRVQEIAVDRFLHEGFEAVTVELIAAEAAVSPMSVYRWFGTKEGIVLWDEYDPPMLEEIARRSERMEPMAAIRTALIDLLDEVYDRERALVLARSRLIHREPALLARALLDGRRFASAIAAVLYGQMDEIEADAIAAAAVASLTVAVDHWQREEGRRELAHHIEAVFAVVAGP